MQTSRRVSRSGRLVEMNEMMRVRHSLGRLWSWNWVAGSGVSGGEGEGGGVERKSRKDIFQIAF